MITYELNNELTTRDNFKRQLTKLGFELSNTLLIDSQMIYRLAIMNHTDRGNYIEQFCFKPDLLARYQRVKSKMENTQMEMKSLVDQKKEVKAAEKNEKTKVNCLRNFVDLDRNLHKHTQELLLFQLYHNQREFFELRPEQIEKLQRELNAVKGDYVNTLMAFRLTAENYLFYQRLMLESYQKLKDGYNVKFQLEREQEKNQQEVALYELRSKDSFENLYLKIIEREIASNQKKSEELVALKNKLEPSW